MNAVSELINNRRKLVRDVACLAAEGRLLQRTAPEDKLELAIKGAQSHYFELSLPLTKLITFKLKEI